jgi:hypothetical protein
LHVIGLSKAQDIAAGASHKIVVAPDPRGGMAEPRFFATYPGGAQEQTFSFGSEADAPGRVLAVVGNYRRIGGAYVGGGG